MKRIMLVALALALAAPLRAQTATPTPDRIADLERKIEALSQEMEKIKLGEAATEPQADQRSVGYAPAASKVYRSAASKVSIGGYGELNYLNFSKRRQDAGPGGARSRADALRAVLYVGYKFNDWILYNSEFEFEHAGSGEGAETRGEISVEQAYLDFKLSEPVGIRAGLVLVPMGIINETHEPTTFHGVNRPSVERNIIPATWSENGVGLFGNWGPLTYRTYLLAGLHAAKTADPDTDGFKGDSALRGGRSGGSNSFADDKAWASRLDVTPVQGLTAGGSLYIGEADHGLVAPAVPVTLWDLHLQGEYRGAEVRALYAQGRIGNADSVNTAQLFTDAARNSVGRRFFGGYAEGAFNVLSLAQTKHYLAPFFRYERYDTQQQTPGGFSKNPANSRVEYTLGLTYKPIPQVAVKLDQQWKRNQARTGVNQWNLGLAYIF